MPFHIPSRRRTATGSVPNNLMSTGRGGAGNMRYPSPPVKVAPPDVFPPAKASPAALGQQQGILFTKGHNTSAESLSGPEADGPNCGATAQSTSRSGHASSQKASQNPKSADSVKGSLSSSASSAPAGARSTFGRGGAGNQYPTHQRVFSFDEELEHLARRSAAPVVHLGRGGFGNRCR